MKPLFVSLLLCSFLHIACSRNNSNNTMRQNDDMSLTMLHAPAVDEPITLNRPPIGNDIDSFVTCRTPESYNNLCLRYNMADTMNEFLFFAIVAADKFNNSHAYYDIAGCLTNYFSYFSIGSNSKVIAIHYLRQGAKKKDESCIKAIEFLNIHIEKELRKLWIPDGKKENHLTHLKAKSLLGNVDDYIKLKRTLMVSNQLEQLLYYSYIMADRYNYEPARQDVMHAMKKGYEKYDLGEFGEDAKYFCSFYHEN